MKVYLVRHAEALEKQADKRRPLSAAGRKSARDLARWLRSQNIQVHAIWHSPKLRAVQTAREIAAKLKPSGGLVQRADIKPMSRPGRVIRDLRRESVDIMLVGHLPHLGRLAGKLLRWDDALEFLCLTKPGVAMVENREDGRWILGWLAGENFFTKTLPNHNTASIISDDKDLETSTRGAPE